MNKRFEQGWELLKSIHEEGGERTIASFEDIASDLGKYIIEFAYGDIYSRPGLETAPIAYDSVLNHARGL